MEQRGHFTKSLICTLWLDVTRFCFKWFMHGVSEPWLVNDYAFLRNKVDSFDRQGVAK